jgi:hypothetical protein
MSEYLKTEDRAFAQLPDLGVFHFTDLSRVAGINEETARRYILRWEQAGKVRIARKDGNTRFYILAEQPIPASATTEPGRSAEGNMWRTMRLLRQFSPTDVAAHSNVGGISVTVQQARAYCRALLDAQYLRVLQTAVPGKREAFFKLVGDTGPAAPKTRRVTGLHDPNTGAFILPEGCLS